MISGSVLKENLLQAWLTINNQNHEDIEKIILNVYEDFSGFDLSGDTGIYLKSGITVSISNADIAVVAEELCRKNTPNYEVIYIKPEEIEYGNESETISVDKCLVAVVLKRRDIVLNNGGDAYMAASALIKFVEDLSVRMHSQFSYSAFFLDCNYGQTLIRKILLDRHYSYIDSLIYDNIDRDNLSFNIARAFIDTLGGSLDDDQKVLVQKLINTPKPLNDYWKEQIAKYA